MREYGSRKPRTILSNITRQGETPYSQFYGRWERYADTENVAINAREVTDSYRSARKSFLQSRESVPSDDHDQAVAELALKKDQQMKATTLRQSIKPHRRRAVRDFQKGSSGFGPRLVVAIDKNRERVGEGVPLGELLAMIDGANVAHQTLREGEVALFGAGDVVVIRDPRPDDYKLFSLFRLSRPIPTTATKRSHVIGHRLLNSDDDELTYDSVESVEIHFDVSDILTNNLDGSLLFVPSSELDTSLVGGRLKFQLSEDFAEDIAEALEGELYVQLGDNTDTDSDSDPDEIIEDSPALQAHMERQRLSRSFHTPVDTALGRGSRTRTQNRTFLDDAAIGIYNEIVEEGKVSAAREQGNRAQEGSRGRGRDGSTVRGRNGPRVGGGSSGTGRGRGRGRGTGGTGRSRGRSNNRGRKGGRGGATRGL
jgi:hypothetical protein